MKIIIVIFFLLSSLRVLGQDPSCTFAITLKNVDINKYSYRFFTETDYKTSKDSITIYLKEGKTIGEEHTESSISKSTNGKSLITTYYSNNCYPKWGAKNQLRIIISRENKKTREIDFMYTNCPLAPRKVDVIVDKFQKGERKYEIYNTREIYSDNKNFDYGPDQNYEFSKIKIYIY